MSPIETSGKVATATINAMRSTPLAIALLLVNIAFLGLVAYVLGHVAGNAGDRDKQQLELIAKLVSDCRPKP
jgi:hypothetical protein